jgi:hypothetical protein
MDEVKYLEGLKHKTNTIKPNEFKRGLLKGYMKKHFMDASFIAKNISNHFSVHFGGNDKFDKIINDAIKESSSNVVDDIFVNRLSYKMTIGAYEERAGLYKLTGEWIVYKQYNGKNYYLTLGSHKETDDIIYKRICDAIDMDFNYIINSEVN